MYGVRFRYKSQENQWTEARSCRLLPGWNIGALSLAMSRRFHSIVLGESQKETLSSDVEGPL